MTEPKWVADAVVLAIHRRQIAEHGGSDGVRDQGLLDSAMARPRNSHFYGDPEPSLEEVAAAYVFGIARNHAFVDGNKRTAMVVYRLFLQLNGMEIEASPDDEYRAIMDLAAGNLTEEEMAKWISSRTRRNT